MKAILTETIYFSGAESLWAELEALDPAFRRAARIVNIDWVEELTISGYQVNHYQMRLEAELDASP